MPGKPVARHDLDIAVGVGEGVARRRQGQRRLEGCVDQAVIDEGGPGLVLVGEPGLDPLPPGRADILEEARADRGGDAVDVVVEVGAEQPGVHVNRPGSVAGRVNPPRKPGTRRYARDHLFQIRRVRTPNDDGSRQGCAGFEALDLARRRRAVALGIAG